MIESPRNHVLEDAIRRAPADLDAYEVYADWLIEQGDPHGELILFDVRRRRSGTTTDFNVLMAEAALLRDRRRMFGLLGELPRGSVEWRLELGFFASFHVNAVGEDAGRAVRLALSHRFGAFLRELSVQRSYRTRPLVTDDRVTARSIWDAIFEIGLPSTLEAVALPLSNDRLDAQCDALAHVARCVFPLRHAPELATHVHRLRRLKSLTLVGGSSRNQLLIDALVPNAAMFSALERLELVLPYGIHYVELRDLLPQLIVTAL